MTDRQHPVLLRLAQPSEVDPVAIAELINDAYKKYPFMSESRTSPDGVVAEMAGGDLILAETESGLVGCALVRPSLDGDWLEEAEDQRHAGSFYFGLAAVVRNAQGTGVGKRLVAEAERIGRERNFQRMLLTTLEEMGNVNYYNLLGYRSISRHVFVVGHWGMTIPHTHHVMAKDLPLRWRYAGPDEVEAVTSLVNEAYRVEDFFIDGNRTNVAEIARCIESDRFLVVDAPDRSLAAAVFVQLDGLRGYFGMLSVAPAHQRTGLGAKLVSAAEDFCHQHGCTRMELTAVKLREELPPWYKKLGYVPAGTAPWPAAHLAKLKTPAHFIVMTKPLAPVAAGHESRR